MSEVTVTIGVSGDAAINLPPSQSVPAYDALPAAPAQTAPGNAPVAYDNKRNRLSIWAGGKWNSSEPLAAATVVDFGAVGDGATDSSAALRAAAAQGVKRLPTGVFLVNDFALLADLFSYSGPGKLSYKGLALGAGAIEGFVKLSVPSIFPTIQSALDFCAKASIRGKGYVRIQLEDGVYDGLSTIEPQIAYGDRVEIIGNEANPDKVVLNFNSAGNNGCGFLFLRGNSICRINGMTLNGNGWVSHGVWADQSYGGGVFANYNSQVLVGGAMRINKFYYGVSSRYGSAVRCEPGVIVTEAGDVAFHAFAGGSLDAQGCTAIAAAHTKEGLGFGFCAEMGGSLDASSWSLSEKSRATDCGIAGFYALTGGSIWAHGATAERNGRNGFLAIESGKIEANKYGDIASTALNNQLQGYFAQGAGSFINANSAKASGNGKEGFLAADGATMDITVAQASGNKAHGFSALENAVLYGDAAVADGNGGNGFNAASLSTLRGDWLTARNNQKNGFYAETLSVIQVSNPQTSSNKVPSDAAEGALLKFTKADNLKN
ncbi:hypothetical protein ABGV49_02215 [Chromobacterium vaccinii]|uniref:Pectate lyase superfamily protein domain-containing protein n=1 Tax=Chromobacterium vaccinii TaxID=1108595 RepID=A0ABV0F722_9NEIS